MTPDCINVALSVCFIVSYTRTGLPGKEKQGQFKTREPLKTMVAVRTMGSAAVTPMRP